MKSPKEWVKREKLLEDWALGPCIISSSARWGGAAEQVKAGSRRQRRKAGRWECFPVRRARKCYRKNRMVDCVRAARKSKITWLWVVHTTQYANEVLQNYILETYTVLLTNVTHPNKCNLRKWKKWTENWLLCLNICIIFSNTLYVLYLKLTGQWWPYQNQFSLSIWLRRLSGVDSREIACSEWGEGHGQLRRRRWKKKTDECGSHWRGIGAEAFVVVLNRGNTTGLLARVSFRE